MIDLKSDKRGGQDELFRENLFGKVKTLIESKTKNYTKKYLQSIPLYLVINLFLSSFPLSDVHNYHHYSLLTTHFPSF